MNRLLLVIATLLLISPLFGVFLSEIIGYHEPLDIAAEIIGLKDISEEINWTPFYDYTVPGLPQELGYVVSGLIGVLAVIVLGHLVLYFIYKYR